MSETAKQVVEAVQHAPGLKMAVAATGAGGMTTAVSASPDWTTIAGLGLTAVGIIISIGSLYLGYCGLQERRRENDLKEQELLNGGNNND